MNKLFFFLLVADLNCLAQNLPYKDKGFALSCNYSQRNIQNYNPQTPIFFPSVEFKNILNFKNKISVKSGASIFVTGHKSTDNFGYFNQTIEETRSIYGYFRFPILLSYNIKKLYIDVGVAPCFRFFNLGTDAGKGDQINRPGLTYTLESHLGYYVPIKKRRIFFELATYFSELGNYIFVTKDNYNTFYKNTYTQNLQLSVGFMLNKTQD